jgi:hypothetical protein
VKMVKVMMGEMNVIRLQKLRTDRSIGRKVPPGAPVAGPGQPRIDENRLIAGLYEKTRVPDDGEFHVGWSLLGWDNQLTHWFEPMIYRFARSGNSFYAVFMLKIPVALGRGSGGGAAKRRPGSLIGDKGTGQAWPVCGIHGESRSGSTRGRIPDVNAGARLELC